MRKKLLGAMLSLVMLSGCVSGPEMGAIFGGAATVGGAVYWLTNQPWMAKLCYYIGDEAALLAMKSASKTVDQDTIVACDICVDYLESASSVPAATVNAELAAAIANLPTDEQQKIQDAATALDDFLPPAVSTATLTSTQLNDIIGFVKGWRDGTTTDMDNAVSAVEKKLAKAQSEKLQLKAKHADKLKASPPTGWFKKLSK